MSFTFACKIENDQEQVIEILSQLVCALSYWENNLNNQRDFNFK